MRPRFPLFLKIALGSFGVVLATIAFLQVVAYREERQALVEKFGLTLQHVAQTAALFIDGDAHERIHGNADAAGADFQRLRGVLARVRRENQLREDQLYTLRPVGNGAFEFVLMLQPRTFVGDRYAPPPEPRRIARSVLEDGLARYTPIYGDQNGMYVSAYAPVRDGTGRPVALLEVDYDVATYMAELERSMKRRMWAVPVALLLSLVLAVLTALSISRAVKQLVEGTEAVRRGEYDRRVDVRTRDELKTLAEAFNQMVEGLRERFTMLKFVPRHTRQLIARQAQGTDPRALAQLAEKRDVAVLFSDIRGFTALSDRLPPQRVIEMLNVYLREEAQIVERHGGAVDKFIGDAVMGVFEGPERFQRAVGAGLEIQAAVRRLNQVQAFADGAIDVGIGIAGGEVVMGSVGYEDRLEFAVIGRFVNLASRLCGQAGAGEVVVSAEAYQACQAVGIAGEPREGVKLKGFADAVTCYAVASPAA